MGITFEESLNNLKELQEDYQRFHDDVWQDPEAYGIMAESLKVAINIMQKYQKIEELMRKEVPECIHPLDRDKYKLSIIEGILKKVDDPKRKEIIDDKKVVKGFKAFDENLQSFYEDIQYSTHTEYVMNKKPKVQEGYSFCKRIADCYFYYPISETTRICEIEAFGDIVTDDNKNFYTNGIRILSEIDDPRKLTNLGNMNSGFFNTGSYNSGDYNFGDNNTGWSNSGDYNTGNFNNGLYNTGNLNSGNRNSGECNIGNYNIGDRNKGNYNCGYYNSGNFNNGIFCTEKDPKIKLFDKESDLTYFDWVGSNAMILMKKCPWIKTEFIFEEDMTDEEKEKNIGYETFGGYDKIISSTDEDRQDWWDKLSDSDKQLILDLPNFDANKFYDCTGIKIKNNLNSKM